MNVRILRPAKGGMIRAIASKSEAHRLIICAALADSETTVLCRESSEDIDATVGCVEALGAKVQRNSDGFHISPIDRRSDYRESKTFMLKCGESGSTLRFLLPVCGALGLRVSFNMSGRLSERPLNGLYDEMVLHGCDLSKLGSSPLTCSGQLISGAYTLPGNISSQFISGLLFALPLLSGDSLICVADKLESRPYVDMTLAALRLFGVIALEGEEKDNKKEKENKRENKGENKGEKENKRENKGEKSGQVFRIPGGQTVISPKTAVVEGDWSNAAFWLSMGAICRNGVSCTCLNPYSLQGDQAIIEILARFGAYVTCGYDDIITVSQGELHGIDINAGNTPDLVPALAAVASVAEGVTIIRNAERLRMKESDRLRTTTEALSNLGADITEKEDGLIIKGKKKLQGGETRSFGDHRIAMAAAILSVACDREVIIRDAEAVRKSYPSFFEDFSTELGGQCQTEG